MYQAASHLANRKEVGEAIQNAKTFLTERDKDKKKVDYLNFLREEEGVYQVIASLH